MAKQTKKPGDRSATGTATATAGEPRDGVELVMVECPMATVDDPATYCPRDLGELPSRYARQMGRLTAGLKADGQRLPNGKPVTTPHEAVLWLLDKLTANTPAGVTSGV